MMYPIAADPVSAADLMIAISEFYPNSTYGSVPVVDQRDALEAYRAFEDGALAEAPLALAAYVRNEQSRTR